MLGVFSEFEAAMIRDRVRKADIVAGVYDVKFKQGAV
jgi:hypothetical protein